MRVYIGGAHNGKRAYVKAYLKAEGRTEFQWFEGVLPPLGNEPVVIAGLENWLAGVSLTEEKAIQQVMKTIENREAILILTDIGRGIVPIEAEKRRLRDTCGLLYQRLCAEADEVTRIWYGIPKNIQKRGERQ